MHASTVLLFAAAGFAAAQTTSASTEESGCGSQIDTIIASCVGTEMAQYNACATNDWDCMCTQITNVLTCYNNCLSDPARNGVLQQQTSYCGAASAYPSTSTMMAKATTMTSASVGSETGVAEVTPTPSATESGAAETSTGAAVANGVAYPGLLTAFFGLAAML